jgi:hypothetical protein
MVGTMCWFRLTDFRERMLQKRQTISSTQSNSNLARYQDNTSSRAVCRPIRIRNLKPIESVDVTVKPVCEHAKFGSKLVCLGDF